MDIRLRANGSSADDHGIAARAHSILTTLRQPHSVEK
jgi:hypothetical protein